MKKLTVITLILLFIVFTTMCIIYTSLYEVDTFMTRLLCGLLFSIGVILVIMTYFVKKRDKMLTKKLKVK